jgi:hypothetical protein
VRVVCTHPILPSQLKFIEHDENGQKADLIQVISLSQLFYVGHIPNEQKIKIRNALIHCSCSVWSEIQRGLITTNEIFSTSTERLL